MIDQNDRERTKKHGNELALTTSSCFFNEEERVNLAEPIGLANPLPPLPREEVVGLAT
jgi:hypothetical protein